jgi:hypothetical protein
MMLVLILLGPSTMRMPPCGRLESDHGLVLDPPWSFISLDKNSQVYISKKLRVPIGLHGPKKSCQHQFKALCDQRGWRYHLCMGLTQHADTDAARPAAVC